MLIEGRNALTEAMKGGVTVEKVMILKGAPGLNTSSVVGLCREKKIPVQFVEKSVLDRLSPEGTHRGFIGFSTDYKYAELSDLLDKEEDLLLILLDGLEDPHNLGAVIRVAECAGADGIVLPRHRSCGVTDTAIKVSCGAASHVKVAKVANLNDVIRQLQERGVRVFAADMDGDNIYRTDLTGNVAFVIGGEGKGVHALTKKLCDGVVSLPIYGQVNSLNASVATGCVVYECIRQKNFGIKLS